MTKLAALAKVNRENLYRMLSKEGNPCLDNLRAVFDALGLCIRIEPAVGALGQRGRRVSRGS
jgi:DNA-binding phage protein